MRATNLLSSHSSRSLWSNAREAQDARRRSHAVCALGTAGAPPSCRRHVPVTSTLTSRQMLPIVVARHPRADLSTGLLYFFRASANRPVCPGIGYGKRGARVSSAGPPMARSRPAIA